MAQKTHNPFQSLDKRLFPKEKPVKAKPAPPPPPDPALQESDEESLFARAMSGVNPIDSRAGRQTPLEKPPTPPLPRAAQDEDEEARARLMDLVTGKVEFSLEFTDEYIQGHVLGLDSKLLNKLRSGVFSPQAHLDIHGLNTQQAYGVLVQFIREQYLKGSRCVLLIPGRGKNSPEGFGILRDKLQAWLTHDPFKRAVLAFCTALPKHGGAGALYVLLRKYKQNQGKILWDRQPPDQDLY